MACLSHATSLSETSHSVLASMAASSPLKLSLMTQRTFIIPVYKTLSPSQRIGDLEDETYKQIIYYGTMRCSCLSCMSYFQNSRYVLVWYYLFMGHHF